MRVKTLDIMCTTWTSESGRICSKAYVYQNNGMKTLFETFNVWDKTREQAINECIEWIEANRKNPQYQII